MKKKLIIISAVAALALGGAAIAGAASGGDDDSAPLSGSTLDRASKAALAATGGGKVNESERDGENGATYEVEVSKPSGEQVDVRLDESFKVVVIEGDREDAGER
jgi:uncharacterized membrane protein YkoI